MEFGFSAAAFALSLEQVPSMAVGTMQGPASETPPEAIPIPALEVP